MTQKEFDSLRFCAGMIAEYGGNWYEVVSCSFSERLFGLGDDTTIETTDLLWVRCENVTQIKMRPMNETGKCPACGEEIVECENCEKTGCPDCDGFIITRDDMILCPECGAACKEDCDKMRALGCGSCSLFANEDDEGQGWCELHQEPVYYIDKCDDRIAES